MYYRVSEAKFKLAHNTVLYITHTEELLQGVGFSAEQIDEFVSRGIVATGPMD